MRTGRRFAAGKDELIAGVAAARGFVALDAGATTSIHRNPWRVSGEFSADGTFWESELWTDLATLQAAYHAQGNLTCLWVKLASPAAFLAFRKALHDNPRTRGLHTLLQHDYYSAQALFLQWFLRLATEGIAIALGLGAMLAVVNALDMALDARRREIAILRALGYRRHALAASLFIEVLVIGAASAGVAVCVAWLAVNGHAIGSSANGSAIQFRMHVDCGIAGWTFAYLLLIGCLSALWPIARAVRTPLVGALHGE
jgi:putative ABC transport system permease protein